MDVWAIVGKVGTLLAVITAAITAWKLLFAKRHKVVFLVETIASPAPKIDSKVASFLQEEVPKTLVLTEKLRALNAPYSKEFDELVRQAGLDAANDLVGKLQSYRVLERPRELVRIELSNAGRKSARSVVIDVDFSFSMFEADSGELSNDGKTFRMAELRPGQKVVLNLWRDFGYGGIRATHDDHVISVQRARKISGWRAWLDQYILQSFMLLPAYLVGMMVVALIWAVRASS